MEKPEETIITEDVSQEPKQQPAIVKKKIVIGLPGDEFSSKFLVSWSNILISLWASDKFDIAISTGTGSYLPFVRMQTLGLDVLRGKDQKPFNGENYDIWISIDSDIIFTPEQVVELIESTEKHPVVSGLYRMSDLQSFAAVKTWDKEYFKKNGKFEFVTQEAIDTWKSETELKYMPVNYVGMGFIACKKEVLDKLNYPYFHGDLHEFENEDGKIIKDMSSEDVNFCHAITEAGFEIVLHTELRVGHLKKLII